MFICSQELGLDYGDGNKLGEPAVLHLEISNPTAIATSYEAHVTHFPAARLPTPPTQPMPSVYMSEYTCTMSVNTSWYMYLHVFLVRFNGDLYLIFVPQLLMTITKFDRLCCVITWSINNNY